MQVASARSQVQVASARSQVQLTSEELKSLLRAAGQCRRHSTKIDPLRGLAWSTCKNSRYFAILFWPARPSAGIGVVEVQKLEVFLRFCFGSRDPLWGSEWSCSNWSSGVVSWFARLLPGPAGPGFDSPLARGRASQAARSNLHIEPLAQSNLRRASCTDHFAKSNLRRATCTASLRRAPCAEQLAQNNLHRATCTETFEQSNFDRATCAEQLAQSNLRRATCTEQLAQSNLYRDICTESVAQSFLHSAAFTKQLAQSKHGATCTEQLAQSNLRRATCAEQLAQTSLRKAPCPVQLAEWSRGCDACGPTVV